MDWHYLSDHQERIPVPDERLRALALGGILRPTTLLWRRGMSGWQSCGEVKPELFAPPTPVELAVSSDDSRSPAAQLALQRIGEGVRPYLPWISALGWTSACLGVLSLISASMVALVYFYDSKRTAIWLVDAGLTHDIASDKMIVGAALGGVFVLAGILVWMGCMLIGCRRQLERSWLHGSVEELQRALARFGSYCMAQVVTLLACLITALTLITWINWPEKKDTKENPPAPAGPAAKSRLSV